MKALDISDYTITVIGANGEERDVPYQVRPSLINLLFGQQGLGALELLSRDDLARKIRDWNGMTLRLEDAEYDQLATAVKTFKGYGKNDVELVRRVVRAETVTP